MTKLHQCLSLPTAMARSSSGSIAMLHTSSFVWYVVTFHIIVRNGQYKKGIILNVTHQGAAPEWQQSLMSLLMSSMVHITKILSLAIFFLSCIVNPHNSTKLITLPFSFTISQSKLLTELFPCTQCQRRSGLIIWATGSPQARMYV